jgi:hypothetical protein
MIETAKQLTATAYQTRLRGGNANLRHQCNLGEFMTEHVVQEHGFGVGRLHLGELNSQSLEFGAGGCFTFHVHASAGWLGLDARFAIQHAALAAARTQRVEADVAGDAGRPGSQTAGPRVGAARERHYDLLEGGLHEIIVVHFPPTKHAVKGMIDYAHEALVDYRGDLMIAALHCVDQLLVAGNALQSLADARRAR